MPLPAREGAISTAPAFEPPLDAARPPEAATVPPAARSWSIVVAVLPIATALLAAFLLLLLDDRLDEITDTGMRVAISATIVLIVLRQTMLLRDRRAALARIHSATAQVEAAMTEARRAAGLLSAAEERFRRLVEQIPAAVYLDRIDRSTVTSDSVYISPRVTGLTGFTPEELAADRDLWDSRILRDDVAAVDLEWDRHVRDGVPFSVTYRFIARDGRTIWLAEDAEILAGPDEQAFSQGIIVDVTERRETEDRLRQAQKMEAVGQLAGGVAHDFNNLLTVITGHAELLLETTSDASSRVDLDAIAAAAPSSAGLVGQLLAFGSRTMLRPEVTDLSIVVDEVMPMLRRLLPRAHRDRDEDPLRSACRPRRPWPDPAGRAQSGDQRARRHAVRRPAPDRDLGPRDRADRGRPDARLQARFVRRALDRRQRHRHGRGHP